MSQQTASDLRAARDLIEHGWCKKTFARGGNGKPCDPDDPDAVRFCMVGALVAAIPDCTGRQNAAEVALVDEVGSDRLGDFNDSRRNKAAILAAFDRAIVAEEATD